MKLPPGVTAPRQHVKSKRFVLTAISKPDPDHYFDGKVGLRPVGFAEERIAKRSSCNRPKGTKILIPFEMEEEESGRVEGKMAVESSDMSHS